jgi:GxxExxY protein
MEFPEITEKIIAAAIKVHTEIGPGVLESVYQTCLQHELRKANISVQSEVALPVNYDGFRLDSGYRVDLLVADLVIVELKCVESILAIHKAQLLTYLRLANKPIGLVLNFNVVHLRDGIQRVLNNRYRFKSRAAAGTE